MVLVSLVMQHVACNLNNVFAFVEGPFLVFIGGSAVVHFFGHPRVLEVDVRQQRSFYAAFVSGRS